MRHSRQSSSLPPNALDTPKGGLMVRSLLPGLLDGTAGQCSQRPSSCGGVALHPISLICWRQRETVISICGGGDPTGRCVCTTAADNVGSYDHLPGCR